QEILGIIPHKLFLELMQVLISKDIEKGLAIIGRMVKDGIDFADFVQNMLIYTHKLSLMKILDKKNFSDIYLEQEDQRNLEKIISTTDADYFLKIIDELDIISDKIKQHIYPWILLELLIVKMAFYENKKNAEIADKSTEKNERTVIQKKTSFPPPGQAKTLGNKESDILKGNSSKNEKEQVSNIDIEKIWPKVLGKIKKEKISLYAFLMAKNRVYIENNCLMIGFRKDCLFHKESLEKRENKEKVETILKEEINAELKITCFIDDYIKNNEKELETIKLNEKALNDQHEKIRTTKKEEKSNDSEDLAILEKARDLFGGNISEE
ncbi:MAG: hypothetical protein PHD33_07060, partial [Atribacterota bacterium]|nr:hypothetical protein [Atribacterota bacterium]